MLKRAKDGFWEDPPCREVPEELALRHRVFPLEAAGGKVRVATADPYDARAADEIRYATGLVVVPELASAEDVEKALRRWYPVSADEIPAGVEAPEEEDAEGPAARLVDEVIARAFADGASDIHVEPGKEKTTVRFRIDGVLRDVLEIPRRAHATLVSRIKVMAGIDIAERRLPQDGRIRVKRPREADLRVSTLPAVFGEAVVLRVLDKTKTVPKLEALGYTGENLKRIRRAAQAPYGLVLLTGPTGSGKTTTLYALLSEIVTREINVITVEDPPEYELSGVRQVAVNPKAGLTFAVALRSILRQDPDVVMIGEIRDQETAKIAVQAAMTGHLVLSTLHTNDAASAPARLIDMGAEPYLVASCLLCVASQRLVRLVCPFCAEDYAPPAESPVWAFFGDSKKCGFRRGKGCLRCGRTGYKGRTAAVETIFLDKAMRELVKRSASAEELKEAAAAGGTVFLADDAKEKAVAGLITPEEAMRVAASVQE